MSEELTPTVITKYTEDDIRRLFFKYQSACKSRQDAQLMKQLCNQLIQALGLKPGMTYSSIAHKTTNE